MTLSLYDVTVPGFIHHLNTLSELLKKGQEHSSDEAAMVESNLIADMKGLAFQVQIACEFAKSVGVKVGGVEDIVIPRTEKTIAELQERIKKTIEFVEKFDPKCTDGKDATEVVFFAGQEFKMPAKKYVLSFVVPNFYFHFTTAYAILRKDGVPVGKGDYLGWKK